MSKRKSHLVRYQESVSLKYQVYRALFMTLPFEEMKSLDSEVLTFQDYCRDEIHSTKSPDLIVNNFFRDVLHNEDFKFKIKILILILQFLERQVVLLDALEDAAFPATHDIKGYGSLKKYLSNIASQKKMDAAYHLIKKYRTRIVLTAHPTQFYPLQILEIIEDLAAATKVNDLNKISRLLLQLGKTSFKNPTRPSPVDEAEVHIYYLERIFYPVIKKLQCRLHEAFAHQLPENEYLPSILELGFWPGGDRDGNPSVTPETTITIAKKLKFSIINIYSHEISRLKRRLTFTNMWPMLDIIKERLVKTQYAEPYGINDSIKPYSCVDDLINDLCHLQDVLSRQHNDLFHEQLDDLVIAIKTFGFYFASIDIRQDSSIHAQVIQKVLTNPAVQNQFTDSTKNKFDQYINLSPTDRLDLLIELLDGPKLIIDDALIAGDPMIYDVIGSLRAIKSIQNSNGCRGLHRYVISNAQASVNVIEVLFLAGVAGLTLQDLQLDIVPLFETITDIENSELIMKRLYDIQVYRQHLHKQANTQFVMLGFSDGIKDGGYLMANWSILQCKQHLYELSRDEGVSIQFFDGRGGTPARGGGNVHKYYRVMNQVIEQEQIQITIQGQTISSDFGTRSSASYNIEQLLTSGLIPPIYHHHEKAALFTKEDVRLLDELSQISYRAYQALKGHPLFVSYMQNITPIDYYGELNNASRPPRRKAEGDLQIKDLRAIPFIGAWNQVKQIEPVYFGLGTSMYTLMQQGEGASLQRLYCNSLYFRTLMNNAMQSILKTNFTLTQYLKSDSVFSELWVMLYEETKLCIQMLKFVSQQNDLLEDDPVTQCSISIRESIVIPLSVIQQYALIELRAGGEKIENFKSSALKKIILKSLAASTNASRNST